VTTVSERELYVYTVQASCPSCGKLPDMPVAEFKLVVSNVPARSYYEFTCIRCDDVVRKHAPQHLIASLLEIGVEAEKWLVPDEAVEVHAGGSLTLDDLIDFHALLEAATYPAAYVALGQLPSSASRIKG
jgi:hypothetical protein